jgi:hypothetical protein
LVVSAAELAARVFAPAVVPDAEAPTVDAAAEAGVPDALDVPVSRPPD